MASKHSAGVSRGRMAGVPGEAAAGLLGAGVWLLDALAAWLDVLGAWWVVALNGLAAAAAVIWGARDARLRGLDSDNAVVAVGMPAFVAGLYAAVALWPQRPGLAIGIGSLSYFVVGGICVAVADPRRPHGGVNWRHVSYALRRRRPVLMWSSERVIAHVRRVYASSVGLTVSALAVLHQDPALLPKWVSEGSDFRPWLVMSYFVDERAVVGSTDVEPMHEATEGFATEREALARASTLARKRRLEEQAVSELPTFLRAVIVESVTGRQPSTLAKPS